MAREGSRSCSSLARRLRQAWRLGKGVLCAAGASHYVLLLIHLHPQPLPGQQRGCHQAIVLHAEGGGSCVLSAECQGWQGSRLEELLGACATDHIRAPLKGLPSHPGAHNQHVWGGTAGCGGGRAAG